MTSKIQKFIEDNIDLIDQNTKESWEKIYDNLYKVCGIAVLAAHKFVGEFTEIILNSGVEDPAEILGYIPSAFLCGAQLTTYSIPSNAISVGSSAF
jgi:hypothetical protein